MKKFITILFLLNVAYAQQYNRVEHSGVIWLVKSDGTDSIALPSYNQSGYARFGLVFDSVRNKPTTLAGYGIADAATSAHTHTFASLTSKPTTLAGYGITDGATANAWVDYSATSTVVGWSSYTTKSIRYQVGYKTVRIMVVLDGTSNAATLTFTLPVALGASAIAGATFLNWGTNNGVNATKAASITGSTVTVGNSPVLTSTAWTTSGTKTIVINIVYETD